MKKQKVLTFKPKAEHTSVYVFHNKKYGTNLFVNALGADGAYLTNVNLLTDQNG
jgi:hypothetical protein